MLGTAPERHRGDAGCGARVSSTSAGGPARFTWGRCGVRSSRPASGMYFDLAGQRTSDAAGKYRDRPNPRYGARRVDPTCIPIFRHVTHRSVHFCGVHPYRRWSVAALSQPPCKVVDTRPKQWQEGITVMGCGENHLEHRNCLLIVVPGLAQVPMLLVRDIYLQ